MAWNPNQLSEQQFLTGDATLPLATMQAFTGRSYLKLLDYTPAEIKTLLTVCHRVKARKQALRAHRRRGDLLEGRNFVLIFEKDSTRTRCAFETAINDEGVANR